MHPDEEHLVSTPEIIRYYIVRLSQLTEPAPSDRFWIESSAHGPRFAHLSKTATEYLQMPCNILPVLPQQIEQNRPKVILGSSFQYTSSRLYTKIQSKSFLGSGEELFKCFFFLSYMGMAAILFISSKPFNQIVSSTYTEGSM